MKAYLELAILEAADDGLDLCEPEVFEPALGEPDNGDFTLTRPVADSMDNLDEVDMVDVRRTGATTADLGL